MEPCLIEALFSFFLSLSSKIVRNKFRKLQFHIFFFFLGENKYWKIFLK